MQQFFSGNDEAYRRLEADARRTCVRFHDQRMPSGVTPDRANVGFEVSEGGAATLFVQRGVHYDGNDRWLRGLFAEGQLCFNSFHELRRWLQRQLPKHYGDRSSPEDLTDLAAVRARLRGGRGGMHLDEQVLFDQLSDRVRGQSSAMRTLASSVTRHLARQKPRRPLSVFAIGPSGVGKTSAAEFLPVAIRRLHPDSSPLGFVRLDMAEYQERHRISQLLGAPQGYVGYGDGAQLPDALRANPRTVVLFDEIEKAHPDVFRTLMNALDAGRLASPSAGQRREIDCRQAIFFFTSNLRYSDILDELERRNAFGVRQVVDATCRSQLRSSGIPNELVGRINCFLPFRPLSPDARAEIVTLAIRRVAEEYGVDVARIDPVVVTEILGNSHAESFGARPDEYMVDEKLGSAFQQAVARGVRGPQFIPPDKPFRCVPYLSDASQDKTGGRRVPGGPTEKT